MDTSAPLLGALPFAASLLLIIPLAATVVAAFLPLSVRIPCIVSTVLLKGSFTCKRKQQPKHTPSANTCKHRQNNEPLPLAPLKGAASAGGAAFCPLVVFSPLTAAS